MLASCQQLDHTLRGLQHYLVLHRAPGSTGPVAVGSKLPEVKVLLPAGPVAVVAEEPATPAPVGQAGQGSVVVKLSDRCDAKLQVRE